MGWDGVRKEGVLWAIVVFLRRVDEEGRWFDVLFFSV